MANYIEPFIIVYFPGSILSLQALPALMAQRVFSDLRELEMPKDLLTDVKFSYEFDMVYIIGMKVDDGARAILSELSRGGPNANAKLKKMSIRSINMTGIGNITLEESTRRAQLTKWSGRLRTLVDKEPEPKKIIAPRMHCTPKWAGFSAYRNRHPEQANRNKDHNREAGTTSSEDSTDISDDEGPRRHVQYHAKAIQHPEANVAGTAASGASDLELQLAKQKTIIDLLQQKIKKLEGRVESMERDQTLALAYAQQLSDMLHFGDN